MINELLERFTGADWHRWQARAHEFIYNPKRRRFMFQKLATISCIFDRPGELVFQRQDTDDSGIENYHYSCYSYLRMIHMRTPLNISLLPTGVEIRPITIHTNLIASPQLSEELSQKDPTRYHFIVSAAIADFQTEQGQKQYKEVPILGLAVENEVIKPFQSKNPSAKTNDLESGGLIFRNSAFDVATLTQLENPASHCQLAEQTVFVANHDQWESIANLAAYRVRQAKLFNPLIVGYFSNGNGERRYFAAYSRLEKGLQQIFLALDNTMLSAGYTDWNGACLDMSGCFAGMVKITGAGDAKCIGPLARNPEMWIDRGHLRQRFYEFSWPRVN